MSWRQRKRFIYGILFSVILIIILIPIILKLLPKPTCFDKKQNQNETGIDCGGPCIPCEILSLEKIINYEPSYIIYPDNSLDLIAEIENKNKDYGLKPLQYKFKIYGVDNETAEVSGVTFILPLQRKYILELNKEVPEFEIARVELELNYDINNWIKFEKSQPKIQMLNYNIEGQRFSAEIINASDEVYNNITASFILFDKEDKIIASVKTDIPTLEPLERQSLKNLVLPPYFGEPQKVIFQPEVDLF